MGGLSFTSTSTFTTDRSIVDDAMFNLAGDILLVKPYFANVFLSLAGVLRTRPVLCASGTLEPRARINKPAKECSFAQW